MIALRHNPGVQAGDVVRNGQNLVDDPSLETAVYLSLFSRRTAEPDDTLPDPNGDRSGFWADKFAPVANRKWGSRLWLLSRTKIDPTSGELLNEAKTYVLESLHWLVEDGAASDVTCTTAFQQLGEEFGIAFQVQVFKPGNPNPWAKLWVANLALL